MTTAAPSTALATIQPAFTDPERLALAGFLAGYRGLDQGGLCPRPAPVHRLVPRPFPEFVRRPPCRHRKLRPRAGSQGPGPRDRHPAAVHHCRVLQVRSRGRAPRAFPGRSRPPSAARLRVARNRPGPQRARRAAGRRRARPASRACADLATRIERAAGLRSNRRRHRAPGPGARASDPDDHPQGRQGGHYSAGAAHGPGDRPGHRGTAGRAGVPDRGRAAAGPARRRADRPQGRPPRRDRKDRHAAHAAARIHHRQLDAGVPLRDVQEAASHADPRTTIRYDRARGSLDRHATYIVATYVAGAAR